MTLADVLMLIWVSDYALLANPTYWLSGKQPKFRAMLKMAERVGFEPTVPVKVRWFSRPELSTTQPPLQRTVFYTTLVLRITLER